MIKLSKWLCLTVFTSETQWFVVELLMAVCSLKIIAGTYKNKAIVNKMVCITLNGIPITGLFWEIKFHVKILSEFF